METLNFDTIFRMRKESSLSVLDERASLLLFKLGERLPRGAWKVLEYSGDGILWLTFTISLIVIGCSSMFHRRELDSRDSTRSSLAQDSLLMGVNLLLGLLLDLAEVGLLKVLFRRPRPRHNSIAKDMNIIVSADAYSFPSGHSSRVSFLAQFALVFFGEQHHAISVVFLWAFIVALSRCMMGRHYCSDVIVGLALGYVTIYLLTRGSMERNTLLCTKESLSEMLSRVLPVRQHP